MTITAEVKQRWGAKRDPEIVFATAWMWILGFGLITLATGFFPEILLTTPAPVAGSVILAFCLFVFFFGQFGTGSALEGEVAKLQEQANNATGRIRLVGARDELCRVIRGSMRAHGKRRRFRVSLRSDQCWSLHAFIILCPLTLILLFRIDAYTPALLTSGALSCILLQRVVVWSTYTITDRTLKIRRSSFVANDVIIATSATPISEVVLAGARLDIDFCQDRAVVETDEQTVTIRLPELLCPHAFAAALIAAVALPPIEKS